MRVLVTGGRGFLGNYVVKELERRGHESFVFSSKEYDLRLEGDVERLFSENGRFDAVIHLAADVGGIGYQRENPGSVLYNNTMMNVLVQEYAHKHGAKKFVGIGSVCSYPKFTQVPFKEESLWKGYPEETNAPYGISKLIMLEQSKAYRAQYDFNAVHLLMINLYGPGDNFDLESSHVIPALIRKFTEAKTRGDSSVTLWGDGSASREFLYVEDASRAIVLAMESYDSSEPVNIGSGQETTIRELAEMIKKIAGFEGTIQWDMTKPNGQPRRCLDTSRAQKFGFSARTTLNDGLKNTLTWFKKN